MADRYYDLAETMNARGAIELAVPFYRQALAMLIQERDQLRQLLPEHQHTQLETTRDDELKGLLIEAAALTDSAQPLSVASASPSSSSPSEPELDLAAKIEELADDLTPQSAQQVLAGLEALQQMAGVTSLPAVGHSLRGKAFLLLGQREAALDAFQLAHQLEPDEPSHSLNLAAACLTQGATAKALHVLRPLYQGGLDQLAPDLRDALLRNLATAESLAGRELEALQLRRHWLQLNPAALPMERWLQWARTGVGSVEDGRVRQEALAMVQDLHRQWPKERAVTELLAETLEQEGDYRQAALLYRDLLRP